MIMYCAVEKVVRTESFVIVYSRVYNLAIWYLDFPIFYSGTYFFVIWEI